MPITHTEYQTKETLYDFYESHSKESSQQHREAAKNMIKVLGLLNHLFPKTLLFGMTSHLRLVLMPSEPTETDDMWKVIIENIGLEDYYYIQYRLPKELEPWENAWVTRGIQNTSFADLEKYILTAMDESGGWTDNEELKQRLTKTN
ncbi:MAG: hypothetical protein ACPGVB_15955 [Chitinophagales bacterium]